jgi:hypothetical protein
MTAKLNASVYTVGIGGRLLSFNIFLDVSAGAEEGLELKANVTIFGFGLGINWWLDLGHSAVGVWAGMWAPGLWLEGRLAKEGSYGDM